MQAVRLVPEEAMKVAEKATKKSHSSSCQMMLERTKQAIEASTSIFL